MVINECSLIPSRNNHLKHLCRVVKRPRINIGFQDLKYWTRDSNVNDGWLQILNSLSGEFRCGELTAIIGPSGAGKSTLLNVLCGYVTDKIDGTITINNLPKEAKSFNKITSYIMQENIIQPRLSVKEAMIYAARLKLGLDFSHEDRIAVVEEVLSFLGMHDNLNTLGEHLSGGQKKRLSIALELIDNRPVIFLDEPTTGLDSFAVKHCIEFLKKISDLDRTVVCTIHQPPSSLLEVFDQLYMLADGFCIYNGSPSQLVPFLANADYACPSNNTPTEYMMELVDWDSTIVHSLKALAQNGKNNIKVLKNKDDFDTFDQSNTFCEYSPELFRKSYLTQLLILMSRMLVQTRRNRLGLCIQVLHHLISGVVIGVLFSGVGNNANELFTITKFCIVCIVYLMYTHAIIPVLLLPLEMDLLKREYFNGWYSIQAYYSAWTLVNVTPLIFLSMSFATFVYYLTDQPREINRFMGFTLILLATSVASQSLGLLMGVSLRATAGAVAAPVLMVFCLAFSINRLGYPTTVHPFLNSLLHLSFLRSSLIGSLCALFYKREPMSCYNEECPFRDGELILERMSIPIIDYKYHLGYVLIFIMVFRIIGYALLICRLNVELSSKIVYYCKKVFNVLIKWCRSATGT